MAFEKLNAFTKDVSDLSDKPALNPTELKAQFDAAPDEVRQYLNKLIDALTKTTAGDSGAKNIGASTITGLTGTNVQALLESVKKYADEMIVSGSNENGSYIKYPDGTLICRSNQVFPSVAINNAAGALFYCPSSETKLADYPMTFVGIPSCTISATSDLGNIFWVAGDGHGTTTKPPTFSLMRHVSSTLTGVRVSYVAVGRWK